MLDEKLLECLAHPSDGSLAIVTHDGKNAHIANTWNSYVVVTKDDRLLIPVGGMVLTEANIAKDPTVQLSIVSRNVDGMYYKGCGFLVVAKAKIVDSGDEFLAMKKDYPWARAILEANVESTKQTL